jgi:hypothetical protein
MEGWLLELADAISLSASSRSPVTAESADREKTLS